MPLTLRYREFGRGLPVLILHGLFGSGRNWQTVAHRLAGSFRVVTPDLRNHGESPHAGTMSYADMAGDVAALAERLDLGPVTLIGHSMGGKVAMHFALARPSQTRRLLVVDVAPVTYAHDFNPIVEGMLSLPVARLTSRDEADAFLASRVRSAPLRQFLLQNLVRDGAGYRWRLGLAEIAANMPRLLGFDEPGTGAHYDGSTLFLAGERSDYIRLQDRTEACARFPNARFEAVPGAGHWVHVEQTDLFMRHVSAFLEGS